MLTRIQVARRLGKSVATVRRMEGTDLHPHVDIGGIHRFDGHEVDCLARQLSKRSGPRSPGIEISAPRRGYGIEQRPSATAELAEANDETDSPREYASSRSQAAELAQLRERVRVLEHELLTRELQSRAAAEQDTLVRARLVDELSEFAESLSTRQLRRAGPELLELMMEFLAPDDSDA
jgi:hypothetical protein